VQSPDRGSAITFGILMSEVEIICVGAAKLDLNALVDHFPHDDERMLAQSLTTGVGGPSITAAFAIARLGIPVGFCGVVGRDPAGDHIMSLLEQEGVSTRWVSRRDDVETCRSMNIISATKATRAIVTVPAPAPDISRVPPLKARWIHFDDVGFAANSALRKAGMNGARLSIDGGNPIERLDLNGIDLYAPTVARLAAEAGSWHAPRDLMQKAVARGARDVVATDGQNGSYVLSDGSFSCVPAFDVPIVSTLGAGDVFHGSILAGLCLGKDIVEATRWGNACAALSCRALDGVSGVPRRPELEAFLNAHPIENSRAHQE
jgi:sulfofructose kinase